MITCKIVNFIAYSSDLFLDLHYLNFDRNRAFSCLMLSWLWVYTHRYLRTSRPMVTGWR